MQAIGEVISRLNNTRMGSTSEICYEHTVQANGKEYTKEIKKITFDGEIFCPICERDRTTQELSDEEDLKIELAMGRRKYNVFHNQSVLTDEDLLDASFKTYAATKKEEINNKELASKAFTSYRDGGTFTTWFAGDPGVGKSHLGMSILRNLNESGKKNKSCLFVSVDEMFLKIRDSFDNKDSRYTEHYFANLLNDVDYLVLDDLGTETGGSGTKKTASDFVMRVLYAITNGRQNKSTIVTTNLTRQELEKMYDRKLVSRLMKNIYVINFEDTTDKRIKKYEI
ncbi:ATP-binding protein [Sporosarcina sp. FSL K6-6792]|uniref:ATP-binding protein n=1 Tax=Sporosarcina sp. FSL K6-6792 TaxID=2921559 RepID=UPI0030F6B94C